MAITTLTYGIQAPSDGDLGTVIFPAINANLIQIDAHTHDGITSSLLTRTSVASVAQAITAAGWALVSNGIYKQTVTLPAGFSYDTISITFRLASSGDPFFPTVVKLTSTTYEVYIN